MEIAAAVETRRPIKETPLQKLGREMRQFGASLVRLIFLCCFIIPLLVFSFLTLDIRFQGLDHLFATPNAKPGNWLSVGLIAMSFVPLAIIFIARRFGGEEASRVVTASWSIAAIAAFSGVSYLSPILVDGDVPLALYAAGFVASSVVAQFAAAAVYDITRGGEAWWRAPFFAALSAYVLQAFLYFPAAYWHTNAPWLNWLVVYIGLAAMVTVAFLGVYRLAMRVLRPRGGFGG